MLAGCDKQEQVRKDLDGEWKIIEYRFTNYNSLTYIYPATGTMTFENCPDEICSYSLNLNFDVQGTPYSKKESGKYEFLDEKGEYYRLYRENANGTVSTIETGRIILITKKDLKTEFTDEYGNHLLILEK